MRARGRKTSVEEDEHKEEKVWKKKENWKEKKNWTKKMKERALTSDHAT
jgi:hypothetical protein